MHLVAYPTLFYSPYHQYTGVVTIQHESPMFKNLLLLLTV